MYILFSDNALLLSLLSPKEGIFTVRCTLYVESFNLSEIEEYYGYSKASIEEVMGNCRMKG